MDMKLDQNLIRQQREHRAWSQGHLADVAGLSLRTIQRIEKNGIASYDSAQALAATFDLSLQQLVQAREAEPFIAPRPRRIMAKFTGASAVAISLFLIMFALFPTAQAQQVKLDVRFSEGDNQALEFAMVNPTGEASEFKVHDKYRLEVTPTSDNDGLFLMTVKVFQNINGDYRLRGNPKVLARDQESAMFIFKDDNDKNFTFWITPSLVP